MANHGKSIQSEKYQPSKFMAVTHLYVAQRYATNALMNVNNSMDYKETKVGNVAGADSRTIIH